VGFFIGIKITSPVTVVLALLAMIFIGLVLAGFGLLIATMTKNTQTFQAVSIAITMPMTFMSGAYIPIFMLPPALRYVAYFNPMTYAVSLFRSITLEKYNLPVSELVAEDLAFKIGQLTLGPVQALAILLVFGVLFITLSALAFARVDFSKMNRSKDDGLEI